MKDRNVSDRVLSTVLLSILPVGITYDQIDFQSAQTICLR